MVSQLRNLVVGFSLLAFVGCGPGGKVDQMHAASKPVTWPTLAVLFEPDRNMVLVMNVQTGNIAGAKKAAADPKLKEAVDAFEAEPIPAEFASPDRDNAKKEVVKGYRDLIAAATESKGDIKKIVQDLQTAKAKLVETAPPK